VVWFGVIYCERPLVCAGQCEPATGQSDPRMLLLNGELIAPVIEELNVFRSWLGGPRAAIPGVADLGGCRWPARHGFGVDMPPTRFVRA